MSYEIRPANDSELKLFYETVILPKMEEVHVCIFNGKIVATVGILPDPDYGGSWMDEEARPMAFLDVIEPFPKQIATDAVRQLRGTIKRLNRELYVQHDHKFTTAEKLLKALGFQPTGEWRRDMQNTGRLLQIWRRPPDEV